MKIVVSLLMREVPSGCYYVQACFLSNVLFIQMHKSTAVSTIAP